jgi:hypothetical protein
VYADLGIAYLQAAMQRVVDMNDQEDRWQAFTELKRTDPNVDARASQEGATIAEASTVLVDKDGTRYVRAGWFGSVRAPRGPGRKPAAGRPAHDSRRLAAPRQGRPDQGDPARACEARSCGRSIYVPAGWEDRMNPAVAGERVHSG